MWLMQKFFQLNHLHYAYFESTPSILDLRSIREGQLAYENLMLANLPIQSGRILDVGCGTCELSRRLKELDFEVHGLAPEDFMEQLFSDKVGAKFFKLRFEELSESENYDLLIFSESLQYIPLDSFIEKSRSILSPGGKIIISDYFLTDDDFQGSRRSGHLLSSFHQKIQTDFDVLENLDITANILPTLDFIENIVHQQVEPVIEYLKSRSLSKGFMQRILMNWIYRLYERKYQPQLQCLNRGEVIKTRRYLFYILELK